MPRITVQVTEEDILLGSCGSNHCPISLAIKRLGFDAVTTWNNLYIYSLNNESMCRIKTPEIAQKFIDRFDEWYLFPEIEKPKPNPIKFGLDVCWDKEFEVLRNG